MVGRDLPPAPPRVPVDARAAVARAAGPPRARACEGVDLEVRAGEIVGVAGVAGNGQSELAELIAGLLPVTAGSIRIDGRDVSRASVAARREAGLAYVPG